MVTVMIMMIIFTSRSGSREKKNQNFIPLHLKRIAHDLPVKIPQDLFNVSTFCGELLHPWGFLVINTAAARPTAIRYHTMLQQRMHSFLNPPHKDLLRRSTYRWWGPYPGFVLLLTNCFLRVLPLSEGRDDTQVPLLSLVSLHDVKIVLHFTSWDPPVYSPLPRSDVRSSIVKYAAIRVLSTVPVTAASVVTKGVQHRYNALYIGSLHRYPFHRPNTKIR